MYNMFGAYRIHMTLFCSGGRITAAHKGVEGGL